MDPLLHYSFQLCSLIAFTFRDLDELEGFYQGNDHYLYSRVGNPNTDELVKGYRLEGATSGVASSSGLSAILAGVLAVVQAAIILWQRMIYIAAVSI